MTDRVSQRTFLDETPCIDLCKHENIASRGGFKVNCCICQVKFHGACVNVTKDPAKEEAPKMFWTCHDCRFVGRDTAELRKNMGTLMGIMQGLKKSVSDMNEKCDNLLKAMSDKDKENAKLNEEKLQLSKQVGELQQKLNVKIWSEHPFKHPKTLVVGSNSVKYLDENKLVNTDVVCRPGAKLSDIQNELQKIPEDRNYNRVVLVAGGIDLKENDPKSIVDSYSIAIQKAKDICSDVTVSSVLPMKTPYATVDKISSLNAGLQVLAEEKECKFIDHQDDFFLKNNDINEGFFDADLTHPNLLGSNRMAKNLKLVCKNRQVFDVATRRPKVSHTEGKVRHQEDVSKTRNVRPGHRDLPRLSDGRHQRSFDNRMPQRNANSVQRSPVRGGPTCWFCGESNHVSTKCRFGGPINCHTCGISGHKKKFCTKRVSWS